MKRCAMITVDENALRRARGDNAEESIETALGEELGWLAASGITIELADEGCTIWPASGPSPRLPKLSDIVLVGPILDSSKPVLGRIELAVEKDGRDAQ